MSRHFGMVAAAAFFVASGCWATAASASTVYSNDFSSSDTRFSGGSTLTTSPGGNQFLYFGGAGGSGTLTLGGLTAGANLTLTFDLYAVGSMDGGGTNGAPILGNGPGDYFAVNAGTTQVFNQAFANFGNGENQTYPTNPSAPGTGAYAINGLGYTGFPQGDAGIQDAEYTITLSAVASSSGSASFIFFDNSNEGTGNEFYGIDNVVVASASGSAVPEPTTWAMMLIGMGAIGFSARRRQTVTLAYS